ncbi:cyclic nucleotide-binding domain-containing protein [Neorhizobium lilium]|uniref:Cyclic nucleotide-binding domain-containing protein n=1 Tax=Neorhizobium lilium TaxID=2503024 RepID=A0A3S3T4F3_9HYPH|nr:helix-turn-helix domain-containing protein [Neorhizobium lilium]RWX81823.1 cyclic nucleotide-binding domain-containing protein [Neorhizobium lilium]
MLMQGKNAFEIAGYAREAVQPRTSPSRGSTPCQSLLALFQMSALETVPASKAVCWEGDSASHLFQVVEGVVRLQRIIGEGRRAITAFQYAGDVVGAFVQGEFPFTAEAVTECKIRRISRKTFLSEVTGSDVLRPEYIKLLCEETAAAHEQMVLLSKKNAEERLCSFLVELASRGGAPGQTGLLQVPMNRQDIADYLGMTIETVSRTISKLAARKIVVPEGRHNLRIICFSRLSRLCGNADAFHSENCHRMGIH